MTVARSSRAQCQCCGGWFPKGELLRQLQAHPAIIGSNLLPYSGYDAAGWSSSATWDGYTVQGCRALASRVVIDDDGETLTEIDGAPSFVGDGMLTSTSSIDVSALTTVRFSVHFSPHQTDCGGEYAVVIGVFGYVDVDAVYYDIALATAKSTRRVWGDIAVSSIAEELRTAVIPYVLVDAPGADYRWAVERLALWDVATYGDCYVPTSGSALTTTGGTDVIALVVCEECRDPRLQRSSGVEIRVGEVVEVAEDLEID